MDYFTPEEIELIKEPWDLPIFTTSGYSEIKNLIQDNKEDNSDKINPSYYKWLKDKCNIEVIDITRYMDFDLGNAVKYILRANRKHEIGYNNKEKAKEDLQKAIWYINDYINHILK